MAHFVNQANAHRKSRGISYDVTKTMRVDRPFLLFVFDATTGLVLCQVVVNDLNAKGSP